MSGNLIARSSPPRSRAISTVRLSGVHEVSKE